MLLAAAEETEDERNYIEQVGAGLPVLLLEPTVISEGGLLSAAARGDSRPFDEIARQLSSQGFALAELGAPAALWPRACAEGNRLWPRMQPGILTSADGTTTSGLSPSGTPRGDRYVAASAALASGGGPATWPALSSLDEAMTSIGVALNQALDGELVLRSDPFFACFPGGGSAYGSHFDGGGLVGGCKLTSICYANAGWRSESGGELQMLDEPSRCWRAVQPLADRLILFRADKILHRVQPTHAKRFALTAWWYVDARHGERSAPGEMRLVRSHFPPGDARRVQLWSAGRGGGATAREVLSSMATAAASSEPRE